MYTPPDPVHAPLHVVTPVFNAPRFKARWKHLHRYAKHVQDSGAILHLVEATFGDREPAANDIPINGTYTRVKVKDELWIKENLINLGIQRLPFDWEYVAWPDGDVAFVRPNWVGETIHQLQHYAVVQMFSEAVDVSPTYEIVQRHRSFVQCFQDGLPLPKGTANGGYYGSGSGGGSTPGGVNLWHPGYAWAARRDAMDAVGGLVDYAILGSADRHMAQAVVGSVIDSVHPRISDTYKARLLEWEFRADRYIRGNVGTVSGLLVHFWHGRKRDRQYKDRWRILVDRQFNPNDDIKLNAQGVYQFCDHGTPRSTGLRDDIRSYFRQRSEDSIDV